jgi:flagellar FliJ protein
MAKFVYRMQNILDIKNKLETQAKTAYAAASQVLRQEEEKLAGLYQDIQDYQERIRGCKEQTLNIQELKWCHEAIEIKKLQVEQQKVVVSKAERNLELARIRLNEVMVERKTHEKLKEKAFEEFKKELEDAEKKEIDELVSYTYNK